MARQGREGDGVTKASKATAIRLTVEAVGVLLLAVLIVVNFEERIAAVNWRLVSLVCVAAVALFGIYRWQMREDNAYDVIEMLMKDGHADLSAHLIVVFAGLSVWVVIQQALSKTLGAELLLGILGIFVGGKALGGFSDAMQKRPPAIDQSRDININPAPAAPTATDKPLEVAVVDQAKPIEVDVLDQPKRSANDKQKKGKPRGKTH